MDAVQKVDWPESDLQLTASVGFTFRPLVMLTVLTYCYATGINRSTEIELATRRDEVLRYFCRGSYPTWYEIQDFRSSHLKLIRQCLAEVLRAARRCPGLVPICFDERSFYSTSEPSERVSEAAARIIRQAILLDPTVEA